MVVDMAQVNTLTGVVVGIAAATTTMSACILGPLSDRIGPRRVVFVSVMFTALMYIPQAFVQHAWQLVLLQALVGVGLGGVWPSISALLARFCKPGEEGAVFGLDTAINAAARTVAPPIGSGLALVFGLRSAFLAAGGLYLAAGLFITPQLPAAELDPETLVD